MHTEQCMPGKFPPKLKKLIISEKCEFTTDLRFGFQ